MAVVVVVGLSGDSLPDEKACYLSRKTREKNVCRGRMVGLSIEDSSGGGSPWRFCAMKRESAQISRILSRLTALKTVNTAFCLTSFR